MATRQKIKKLCPSHTFFFAPTLKALDELGGSGSNEEIYKKVVSITELSTEILDEMHNFTMTEVEYRLMWARRQTLFWPVRTWVPRSWKRHRA